VAAYGEDDGVSAGESDFRGWVAEGRSDLRRTAYLLCGDWYLADDLVQETLARMFSVWDRVTRSGAPDGYARKVLVNLALDHRRRPSRREASMAVLPERPSPAEASYVDGDGPAVIAALQDVPTGQRAVLVLRYWEDRSIEETARLLGTSEGNVKSQSSRGLTALRAALAERGIVTEPMPEEAQS
jgi:RNA polymerase sigma-70 factor (sigma-E family)